MGVEAAGNERCTPHNATWPWCQYQPGLPLWPPKREAIDDGWYSDDPEPLRTEISVDTSRTVISRNQSPDIPFDQSINPNRGCEHGCIYCYARPTDAWLGPSPGLDFESRLFYKPDAAAQPKRELAKPGYKPAALKHDRLPCGHPRP